MERVFLLSPARIGGPRSDMLLRKEADFELATRLRLGIATIGEVYSFISGLYFRGKITYANAFGYAPAGVPPVLVVVPGFGLVPPSATLAREQLQTTGAIDIDERNEAYRLPLVRDAERLERSTSSECRFILLGSVATQKYSAPLLSIFGERLMFPSDFVGRGDMSRGGLMLRAVKSGEELSYACVQTAVVRGKRPEKLLPQ